MRDSVRHLAGPVAKAVSAVHVALASEAAMTMTGGRYSYSLFIIGRFLSQFGSPSVQDFSLSDDVYTL